MKKITVEVSDELIAFKEKQGIRWRSILDLGMEAINLRFERNKLLVDLDKIQKANGHIQTALLKAQEELDAYKAGVKP